MDAELVYQIVDHVHAITTLVLGCVQKQGITLENTDYNALRFHLRRINALLVEVGYPMRRNPILSDERYHNNSNNSSDDKETQPMPSNA